MNSEKFTRETMYVQTMNAINLLQEFSSHIKDSSYDLADIGMELDKITERVEYIKDQLEACEDY